MTHCDSDNSRLRWQSVTHDSIQGTDIDGWTVSVGRDTSTADAPGSVVDRSCEQMSL